MTIKLVGADDASGTNNVSGQVIYCRFQAERSGTVTEFRIKCGASGQVIVAIYSHDATNDLPLNRLGYNNTPQDVTSGWNTLSIPNTEVVAGEYYWLAVDMSNVTGLSQYVTPTGRYAYKKVTWGTYTFPDPADSGLSVGTNAYFLYAGWGLGPPGIVTVFNKGFN